MGRIGFLADDLTGAADVLAQAHGCGLDAAVSLDPRRALPDSADVVGVAGPIRSRHGDELETAIRGGLAPFRREPLDALIYKICSTFDSSPTVGNIGRAIEILNEYWPTHGAIPVVPSQPELGRYTAFSEQFAVYDDTVYRLDRHPVMSRHPATPMAEADLRVLLAEQNTGGRLPRAIHLPAYTDGSFDTEWIKRRTGVGEFVVDAVTPSHMDSVAARLLDGNSTALVVGSGGIVAALARKRGTIHAPAGRANAANGPVLAVSGSASPITALQIEDAISRGWAAIAIPPAALTQPEPHGEWVSDIEDALATGRHVVAHTVRGPDDVRLTARPVSAADVGGTMGRLARFMVKQDLTSEIAIFGGDSSSYALLALGVTELRVLEQFMIAVPICAADGTSAAAGCRLLLKGGQVGPVDILDRFATGRTENEQRTGG